MVVSRHSPISTVSSASMVPNISRILEMGCWLPQASAAVRRRGIPSGVCTTHMDPSAIGWRRGRHIPCFVDVAHLASGHRLAPTIPRQSLQNATDVQTGLSAPSTATKLHQQITTVVSRSYTKFETESMSAAACRAEFARWVCSPVARWRIHLRRLSSP